MEPILFAGHPAGSSLGLVAAFEWLGKPYRLTRVHMPDDMLTEAYARVNGRQETPVLIREDGSVLTETMAIARWLELRDDERRISFEPGSAEAHRMHQFIGFLNTGFTGAFTPLWVALEMQDGREDYKQALRRFGRDLVARRHHQLEAMIGSSPYLVGDRPSLADAVFVGVARWAEFHQALDLTPFPKIQALKARLEADPAVRFAHAIEDGVLASGSGALHGLLPLEEVLDGVAAPLAA
ncbi:glutathione S-transferase family protein [Labrys neptuniae]|uniref:Glutathione S-transferase family protein n=1 Tax=Labrys neptuniae TaxID=376174 RepID=A0ABV3PSK7_9HYPH